VRLLALGPGCVDEHDAVISVLSRLLPRMRAVLVLRYHDDLTEA
jgi:DNA-directed RNA polymerase specialized sigma24 family protein